MSNAMALQVILNDSKCRFTLTAQWQQIHTAHLFMHYWQWSFLTLCLHVVTDAYIWLLTSKPSLPPFFPTSGSICSWQASEIFIWEKAHFPPAVCLPNQIIQLISCLSYFSELGNFSQPCWGHFGASRMGRNKWVYAFCILTSILVVKATCVQHVCREECLVTPTAFAKGCTGILTQNQHCCAFSWIILCLGDNMVWWLRVCDLKSGCLGLSSSSVNYQPRDTGIRLGLKFLISKPGRGLQSTQ